MKYALIILILAGFAQGCYYDGPDLLDPNRTACDTSIVTFSGTINPILIAYCSGCHSGVNAPSRVRTDNYASVKTIASNGRLLGTVTHSPGFSPMPKNGSKLNTCNIEKVRKWVTAGAPNN